MPPKTATALTKKVTEIKVQCDMRAKLDERLQELKTEYESGQKMLAEQESRSADLRETLLRIAGAIQVFEEELERPDSEDNDTG